MFSTFLAVCVFEPTFSFFLQNTKKPPSSETCTVGFSYLSAHHLCFWTALRGLCCDLGTKKRFDAKPTRHNRARPPPLPTRVLDNQATDRGD